MLTITEMLRKHGVVGKFVEFYGDGVAAVPLANRATIGNMSPEFGSTCAIFPIDEETLRYLRLTGRADEQVALVEAYAKEQGLWHDPAIGAASTPSTSSSTCRPSCRRSPARSGPQDRVALTDAKEAFRKVAAPTTSSDDERRRRRAGGELPGQRPDPAGQPRRQPTAAPSRRRRQRSLATVEAGVGHHGRRRPTFEIDHGAVVDRRRSPRAPTRPTRR